MPERSGLPLKPNRPRAKSGRTPGLDLGRAGWLAGWCLSLLCFYNRYLAT